MRGPVRLQIGDSVEMRKPHPCGARVWEVTRLGMEVTLKCSGCGRKVQLARAKLDRALQRVTGRAPNLGGWEETG